MTNHDILSLIRSPKNVWFWFHRKATIRNLQSGSRLSFLGVFFLETLDSTRGINQFLFAGEKRMASGTDFNLDFILG